VAAQTAIVDVVTGELAVGPGKYSGIEAEPKIDPPAKLGLLTRQ
jgi:hypothetical protein